MRLRVPLFLATLLIFALVILPAHAGTYVGYGAANNGGGTTCPSNCEGNGGNPNVGQGETIKAPFAGTLVAAGIFTTTVGVPTQIVILTFPAGTTPGSTTYSCGSLGNCGRINSAQTFTVQDVESLSGMASNAFNTINLANPVTVTNGQWVAIVFMAATAQPYIMNIGVGPGQPLTLDTQFTFGSTNPTVGSTANSAAGDLAGIVGGSFNPSGATNTVATQCYGNCGSPAITLANTNSTHLTNFNQSITLFYMAQSNLNGFVVNVTTRVAKTYSNGEAVAIGLYTVDPTCTAANNPFTPQCPGFLVQQQGLSSNPAKGVFSMNSNTAVQNGQWFGVAVTGAFQGLDLNDTNTNVSLNQAAGQIPTVISQFAGLGTSKLALYAYVRGNSIIIGPSGGQIPPGCQTVTCGILALWIALGGDTAAGLGAFLIVLGLITGFFLYVTRQHNPDGSLKGFALPVEFLGIIAVVVLIMFSVAGAIPAWIPGVIIFLVAGFFVAGMWGHRRHSNTVQG